MSAPRITKTQARAHARRARQYGYSRTATTIGLRCPLCEERVTQEYSLYDGTITKQLDAMMMMHLDGYCEVGDIRGEVG